MSVERDLLDQLMIEWAAAGSTLSALDAAIPHPPPPPPPPPPVNTVRVLPGEDAQAGFNSLLSTGGVLDLAAGHHPYNLNLTVRGTPRITVSGVGATLRGFTTINGQNVSFRDVGFIDPNNIYNHVAIGGTKSQVTQLTDVPSGFEFINVSFTGPCRRGLMANCADLLVDGCTFRTYYSTSSDSCAITGWNGAARHQIRNTLMEAASYNIAYGGSDAASEALFPQDILIENCTLTKPYAWKGQGYSIKNLFEMKCGFRVTFRNNLLDGCWSDAWPQGVAIILNTANQENTNPTARVEDLVITGNTIRNVGCYIQLVGRNAGPYVSGVSRRITARNNRFETMHLEGIGRAISIIDGPEDVEIAHNTFAENRHSLIEFSGSYATSLLVFKDNIGRHGTNGLIDGNGQSLSQILARLDMRYNALEVRSGTQPQDPLPATNVYYPAPIVGQNLSAHVTSDGLLVGA